LDAFSQAGKQKVIVDLGNVDFVSSVAFRPLLSLRRGVSDRNARLIVCNLSEFVAGVFNATRLLINPHSTGAPFEAQANLSTALTTFGQRQ
jgi:anti-anti-sigma factor